MRGWLYVLLAACTGPADNDRDNDGIEDALDRCPSIPDDGVDTDADRTPDACDACPLDGHDDDHDGHDDSCDSCPGRREHLDDRDDDGLGDACDPFAFGMKALPSHRLFFEGFPPASAPFVGAGWEAKGVVWDALSDRVYPRAPLGADDGLLYTAVSLPATAHVEIGVDPPNDHYAAGERWGIRLVDDAGAEQAACFVECTAADTCQTRLRVGAASAEGYAPMAFELYLRLVVDTRGVYCFNDSDQVPVAQVTAVPPTGTKVMLLGSPTAQIQYVDAVAHGP